MPISNEQICCLCSVPVFQFHRAAAHKGFGKVLEKDRLYSHAQWVRTAGHWRSVNYCMNIFDMYVENTINLPFMCIYETFMAFRVFKTCLYVLWLTGIERIVHAKPILANAFLFWTHDHQMGFMFTIVFKTKATNSHLHPTGLTPLETWHVDRKIDYVPSVRS